MTEWIKNTGKQPVADSVLVDTLWTDGSGNEDVEQAGSWHWGVDMGITHWRLHNETPTERVITFDELVDKIKSGIPVEDSSCVNGLEERDTNPVADTNPKKQYGVQSIPLNLWSPLASAYGALGLYNGGLKYGFGNYKGTPVEASIYIAAAMRHLSAWAEGEEYDSKDGVPNLGGVLANIAILLDARAAGTLIDDRIVAGGYLKEREELSKIVVKLNELHKDKQVKHFYLKDF